MPSFSGNRELGTKLGPKLAKLFAEHYIYARKQLLGHDVKIRTHAVKETANWIGEEVADLIGPHLEKMIASGEMSQDGQEFLAKIASGQKQWQAMAGSFLLGGTTGAFGQAINNLIAPGVREAINLEGPKLPPTPEVLAQFAAHDVQPYADAQKWANLQGLMSWAFDNMVQLAQTVPDLGTLHQLINRGEVSLNDARYWIRRAGVDSRLSDHLLGLRTVPLSPADLADMVVRGIATEDFGRSEARKSGVPSEDFDKLVLDTGEPPSLTDLLGAYRRKFIDRTRLEHGIRQSRTRNEWIDVIEALRYTPMSTADAVEAHVQGYIDEPQSRDIADQNGLLPGHWDILNQTAGEPISKEEAIELNRRGVIDQAQLEQAIRESRLKNKYIPAVLALRHRVLPERTVASLHANGAIDDATTHKWLKEYGLDDQQIEAVLKSGSHTKTAKIKDFSLSVYLEAYRDGAITKTELNSHVKILGFSQAESDFISRLEDIRISTARNRSVISRIRAQFVAGHIDSNAASNRLDAIHVLPSQRDNLLHDWEIERGLNIRTLTEAQIIRAMKKGVFDQTEAHKRLVTMGYSSADATILIEMD